MKHFLIPAFLLLAISGFAQNEPRTLLYLTDGSFLKATIEDTLPGQILQVRLTDGSRIELAQSLLWQVREVTQSDLLLPDGRKILDKGFWSAVAFHTLSARSSSRWANGLRWGLGAQYEAGYQFSPGLAIGAGLGIDAHEYLFFPVFVEARGNFANTRSIRKKKNQRRWFSNLQGPRHRRPLSYSLQLGYNLPATTLFGTNEEGETIKGRWLVYPAIGILLPSRRGPAFRLDAGYKIQSFRREYHSPWNENYHVIDKVVLKSTAIRATWIF